MQEFIDIINQNLPFIAAGLSAVTAVSLIIAVISLVQTSKLKKRLNKFDEINTEDEETKEQLGKFYETAKEINQKYDKLSEAVMDVSNNMDKCIQKVGIIRYNPFDEAGGNLCFAIALLDSENNGIILNGIHSRSGCYTYAKPVELGVSEYVLSQEELQALNMAVEGAYSTENRQETIKEIRTRLEETAPVKREKKKKGLFGKKHSKVSEN